MQFALYRYEFEVMEKKDSSASLFPNQWDNLTPREAFDRKSELLDELLEKDYKILDRERKIFSIERDANNYALPNEPIFGKGISPTEPTWKKRTSPTKNSVEKTPLQFTNGHKKPLFHQYVVAPKDGFTILELARHSNMSHHPHPFQANAVKEDDYKSQHIILDNRGTHQRVAIEEKASVFSTDAVAASLARALCKAFARYGLKVKVVPIRDDKHFWKIVNDRKQYPKGFKRLRVVFPQINDPIVTENMKRFNLDYQRTMFGCTNYVAEYNAPQGEKLNFNEEDEMQRLLMEICNTVADSVELSPIGGRKFTIGGKCAKTAQMGESERQSILENNLQEKDLFGNNPMDGIKTFMDKAY